MQRDPHKLISHMPRILKGIDVDQNYIPSAASFVDHLYT
jgi:hypothetical protein